MNTSKYVPYESIAKNIFANRIVPECPGIGGTGFFVKFPPFHDIFYVTARHCVYDGNNYGDPSTLKILVENGKENYVKFDHFIDDCGEGDERQDIIIFHVDNLSDKYTLNILNNRALELWHQEDVEELIKQTVITRQRFRTVGYPDIASNLDYNDDKPHLELRPRGFHGIAEISTVKDHFSIVNTNWEHVYDGFSGSPILIFAPKDPLISREFLNENELDKKDVHVIVIGMLVMGSKEFTGVHFLNINFITDAIAYYFNNREDNLT